MLIKDICLDLYFVIVVFVKEVQMFFLHAFSVYFIVLCAGSFVEVMARMFRLLSLSEPILQYQVSNSFCLSMSKFSVHLFLHLHSTHFISFLVGIFFSFSVICSFLSNLRHFWASFLFTLLHFELFWGDPSQGAWAKVAHSQCTLSP